MYSMEAFLNSLQTEESRNNYKRVFSNLQKAGMDFERIESMSVNEIIDFVLKTIPKSKNALGVCITYVINYLKYSNNESLATELLNIDRQNLWENYIKNGHLKKFLSASDYDNLIKSAEVSQLNALWYRGLISTLWEGIYSSDMSVIKNLRSTDIRDNKVLLRTDNEYNYELEISKKLAADLFVLGSIDTWERRSGSEDALRFFTIPIYGVDVFSCFKIEHRGLGTNYYNSYLDRIRSITKEYLGYPVRPFYIYISGIVNRIKIKLENLGFDLRLAFEEDGWRNPIIGDIIKNELQRCNCEKDMRHFLSLVNGFVSDFE